MNIEDIRPLAIVHRTNLNAWRFRNTQVNLKTVSSDGNQLFKLFEQLTSIAHQTQCGSFEALTFLCPLSWQKTTFSFHLSESFLYPSRLPPTWANFPSTRAVLPSTWANSFYTQAICLLSEQIFSQPKQVWSSTWANPFYTRADLPSTWEFSHNSQAHENTQYNSNIKTPTI